MNAEEDRGIFVTSAFLRLRQDWADGQQRRITFERDHAPRHNLIRLLALERSEIGLHSPLLCDLLDPYGSHGQGGLFLWGFLDLLVKRHAFARTETQPYDSDVPEPGEWFVLPERDKIDISIRSRKAGLLVLIENKIGAREQENQLCRYRQLLDGQSGIYPKRGSFFFPRRAMALPKQVNWTST